MLKKSQAKFVFYFLIAFVVLFGLLYSAGLVPSALKPAGEETWGTISDKKQQKIVAEAPERIVIEKIGVDSPVLNPQTTDVKILDEYLTQGTVHYPGSGLLGSGNMFIFGHSSNLTVVRNPAYKVFSQIKTLAAGDIIKVYDSAGQLYHYIVTSVTLVDENKALVDFGGNKNMLTLSTCNTLGAKSERYVVEADYLP